MSTRQGLIDAMQQALTDLSSAQSPDAELKAMASIQAGFGLLEADVMPPDPFFMRLSYAHNIPLALGTAIDQGFAEILGDKSLTSVEFGEKSGLPKTKVATLLRLLAGRGIFKEVRPDLWANTKMSKALDSGLTIQRIHEDPIGRYIDGTPLVAWLQFTTELGARSSAAMIPAFREKKWKESYKASETRSRDGTTVDGGLRARAFAKKMEMNDRRTTVWTNYPWADLGESATLVDVGGGVGSAVAFILPVATNISKAVVQDTGPIIKQAEDYWSEPGRALLSVEKVELQEHDFFNEQPIKGASVYFLRYIMHDWCETDCVKILKRLHDAASSESRLLIVDTVINHACHDISEVATGAVEGAYFDPMPEPLPTNGGRATEVDLLMDVHILAMLNGKERTYTEFKSITEQAGWKPKKVYDAEGGQAALKIMEFIKA